MRHKPLTQRTLFVLHVMEKRYAESAFRDACRTSSDTSCTGCGHCQPLLCALIGI